MNKGLRATVVADQWRVQAGSKQNGCFPNLRADSWKSLRNFTHSAQAPAQAHISAVTHHPTTAAPVGPPPALHKSFDHLTPHHPPYLPPPPYPPHHHSTPNLILYHSSVPICKSSRIPSRASLDLLRTLTRKCRSLVWTLAHKMR